MYYVRKTWCNKRLQTDCGRVGLDSCVRQNNDDVRCAEAVSAGWHELLRSGNFKRVDEVSDVCSSGVVLDAGNGILHSRPVILVVEVELVAGGRRRRVADEADARVVLSDVQLADDVVDEAENSPKIGAPRIAATDRPRAFDHEDDVCPRELARYGS